MGNDLLASKVITTEAAPGIRTLPALATAVLGICGISERGPMGVATLCTSFEDFVQKFGGDFANSAAVLQVRGFFQGGGQFLVFTRTCHYTDINTPATATATTGTKTLKTAVVAPTAGYSQGSVVGPWDLTPADTLVVTVDGGAPATATFNATAAARQNGVDEPFALADSQTLTLKIDEGALQTVTFLTGEFVDIANATAEEVAAVINAKMTGGQATVTGGGKRVTITSDKQGTGSGVNVTGGTANAALQFTTGLVSGTGNVADINAVSNAEAKAIVELAVAGCTVTSVGGCARISSNTTGPASSILVGAASTADDEMGFDNATHSGASGAAVDTLRLDGKDPGSYANDFKVRIEAATSGVSEEFNMTFERSGIALERFPNLSMDDAAPRYVETIVNAAVGGSVYLAGTDLDAVASSQRPANGLYGPLTGGGDGLAGIADTDFIGSAAGKTGLRAFDLHTPVDVTILAVPDRPTAAVHQAMYQYSEVQAGKRIFCIFDPPASMDAAAIVAYFTSTAALYEATEVGAMLWPRIKVYNPNKDVYGDTDDLTVCNSGYWAATMARVDGTQKPGIYQPPAGIEYGQLLGVIGVEAEAVLDESVRDVVFPKNVNPINLGAGYYADGGRCAKTSGNFGTIGQRRGASFIEQTLKAGMLFAKHRNNNPRLRAECDRTTRAFLLQQMRREAFASMDPDTAFVIDWDVPGLGLNNASVQHQRLLKARIGLAFSDPAEFVWMEFSADLRAIEEALILEAA
jgi:hypothetical protein